MMRPGPPSKYATSEATKGGADWHGGKGPAILGDLRDPRARHRRRGLLRGGPAQAPPGGGPRGRPPTGPGRGRHRPQRRSRRLPHGARHGHPAQHRHGAQPGRRPADAHAVPGRPDRARRATCSPRSIRARSRCSSRRPRGSSRRTRPRWHNARVDLERYRTLVKGGFIPQQQLDTQAARSPSSRRHPDRPGPDRQRRLQLTYCASPRRSPAASASAWSIPATSSTPPMPNGLVVITQLQPIAVVFTIPEDNLPPVLAAARAGGSHRGRRLRPRRQTKLASGVLVAVDNQIDPTTGTVRLKAVVRQRRRRAVPESVRQRAPAGRHAPATRCSCRPRRSSAAPQGTFVYVVKPDKTVELRKVTLGPERGRRHRRCASGVAAGEPSSCDGVDKLRARQRRSRVRARPTRERPGRRAQAHMNPSRAFILRPVATSLLMVAIAARRASSPTASCRSRRCRRSTTRRSRC